MLLRNKRDGEAAKADGIPHEQHGERQKPRGSNRPSIWDRRLSNWAEPRVPAPEHVIQFVVENLRPRLQQQMRSSAA